MSPVDALKVDIVIIIIVISLLYLVCIITIVHTVMFAQYLTNVNFIVGCS